MTVMIIMLWTLCFTVWVMVIATRSCRLVGSVLMCAIVIVVATMAVTAIISSLCPHERLHS